MGFIALSQNTFECKNLFSSVTDMEVVNLLLKTELEKGFVIGLFTIAPF